MPSCSAEQNNYSCFSSNQRLGKRNINSWHTEPLASFHSFQGCCHAPLGHGLEPAPASGSFCSRPPARGPEHQRSPGKVPWIRESAAEKISSLGLFSSTVSEAQQSWKWGLSPSVAGCGRDAGLTGLASTPACWQLPPLPLTEIPKTVSEH